MALEGTIDKKQLEALKALAERWTGDPVRFRLLVTVLLLIATVVLVEMPLAQRLALARARLVEAKKQSALAHDVRGYSEQLGFYEPRVAVSPDLVDWQNYILGKLAYSSATLISLEPKNADSKGVFQVVQMELVARGTSYREFVEFIDRIERGERIVRVEKLRIEKHQASMYLTCIIKGLIKSSAKAADAGKGEGAADDSGTSATAAAAAPSADPADADAAADADAEDADAALSPGHAEPAPAPAGDGQDEHP